MGKESFRAVDLFLDGLAEYLREYPDAGPSAVMRDIPEINLRAENGRAIRLYEVAVVRALEKGPEEPFAIERVREKISLAHKMMG